VVKAHYHDYDELMNNQKTLKRDTRSTR